MVAIYLPGKSEAGNALLDARLDFSPAASVPSPDFRSLSKAMNSLRGTGTVRPTLPDADMLGVTSGLLFSHVDLFLLDFPESQL